VRKSLAVEVALLLAVLHGSRLALIQAERRWWRSPEAHDKLQGEPTANGWRKNRSGDLPGVEMPHC
jgi:hypothetical protein